MEIREAILRAADSIEKHPQMFRFTSVDIPDGCGSPGCALGWIAHFLGWKEDGSQFLDRCATTVSGAEITHIDWYGRMDSCDEGEVFGMWRFNAKRCAKTLRAYADKYHPEIPKTDDAVPNKGIPDNVLSIFREDIAA